MPTLAELPKSLRDLLRDHGYQVIDTRSAYSLMFHKPWEDTVLKLYKTSDHAYAAYVDFCRQQTCAHFPRVSRRMWVKNTAFHAVKIERLLPGDYNTLDRVAINFDRAAKGWPLTLDEYTTKQLSIDFPREAEDYINWMAFHPGLALAFELLIQKFGHDASIMFDMHAGNMMMRDDMIVIIDPVQPDPLKRIAN